MNCPTYRAILTDKIDLNSRILYLVYTIAVNIMQSVLGGNECHENQFLLCCCPSPLHHFCHQCFSGIGAIGFGRNHCDRTETGTKHSGCLDLHNRIHGKANPGNESSQRPGYFMDDPRNVRQRTHGRQPQPDVFHPWHRIE